MRLWPNRLGLRTRITLAFALGALLLSTFLAVITWGVTRDRLMDQRQRSATSQTVLNARFVNNRLGPEDLDALEVLSQVGTPEGSSPILRIDQDWFAANPIDFGQDSLPTSLQEAVIEDQSFSRMRYEFGGATVLAVGLPLPTADAAYFEVVSLDELEQTLNSLGIILIATGALTTLAGAGLGLYFSRRTLLPLHDVGKAARAIAGGRLATRLEHTGDPDLAALTESFNDMAEALEQRIERDARFASEVSHELRSPLMTFSASLEVLRTRRDEMPERSRAALDLLDEDMARFQQLVEDLLEISLIDAGADHLDLEPVNLTEFVIQAVAASGTRDVPVEYDDDLSDLVVQADKRRLVRVMENLLDNADKYAGGPTRVELSRDDRRAQIAIEDAGPGVPAHEQTQIFERFSRGTTAASRGTGAGVGLGLALVDEHMRLHGGSVHVEAAKNGEGGSRFVVELPLAASP